MVRPKKYNDDELIDLLKQVRSEITTDISPYIMEKHTGVSKAVWRNRFEKEIEQLNDAFNNPFNEKMEGLHMPLENVATIYEKYKDKENVLVSKLNSYDIFVQNLLKMASQVKKLVENEKQLQEKILTLEEDLRRQKEATMHYEEHYLISVGQSTFGKQYRTVDTEETLSLKKKENVRKVDFISRNSDLFE
mgnify:CR=1 FL=1